MKRRDFLAATAGGILLSPAYGLADFAFFGPSEVLIDQGTSVSAILHVQATRKPYRNVSLAITNLPPGITATIQPTSGKPTFFSTLTLTAASSALVGDYQARITARDAKGTKTLMLIVRTRSGLSNPAPPPVIENCTIFVTNASELQTALSSAVAGDVICLADGTYTGQFTVNGNSGTAGNPITLRAQNPRQAFLEDITGSSTRVGLDISRNYWVIKDIHFRHHQTTIRTNAGSVTGIQIKNCIIEDFTRDGIRCNAGGESFTIDHNVIAFGASATGANEGAAIMFISTGGSEGVDNSTISNNVIYATGDNGYQAGDKNGYGIYITNSSNNNTIQGNVLFCNGGKGQMRLLAGSAFLTSNNTVRDNMTFWGEGGSLVTDDCGDDSNSFINNLSYGVYHSHFSTKGNVDDTLGHHIVRHNTFYIDDFSRIGNNWDTSDCTGGGSRTKHANTHEDNLYYGPGNQGGLHRLIYLSGNQAADLTTNRNNLFWANDSTESDWISGYSYAASDIHAFGSEPLFVNAAGGDFSLQGGSPGKNAASDGTDIGIAYNTSLRQAMSANLLGLQTAQQDALTGVSIHTFTGLSANTYYQVWFYVPNAPATPTAETFTFSDGSTDRDISTLHSSGSWLQSGGPARWITLGRHITDGSGNLSIDWETNNAVEKLFVRRLPSVTEAYGWL